MPPEGAAYDTIAEWYDEWVGGSTSDMLGDPFLAPVVELVGEVAGLRVCDLACGQGRVARYLADRGAHVLGVDASGELLAIARRYERLSSRGIAYVQNDARTLASIRDATFDGVVCNMSLMDISDLRATIRSVRRVLRPHGWFVFSAFHPCFNTPRSGEYIDDHGRAHRTITDYFTEGYWRSAERVGPPRTVGAYHWTLATYVNALADSGLVIERISEATASRPVWQEVPAVWVVRCRVT